MPVSKVVQDIMGKKFDVLDKGFIVLVDVMGDDSAICQAARVSYGKGTKTISQDKGLIRYLMRHRHTTPLEMVEFKFLVKLPIFVARQWIRHRTANVNEYSARYSILEDEFYIPEADVVASQSTTNMQGREGLINESQAEEIRGHLTDHSRRSYEMYEYLLNETEDDNERANLTRELARMVIPTNVYTQWYWKIDLHNLLHFLSLRLDSHAQYEIQEYARVMAEMVRAAAPVTYEAFEDYRLNSMQLTGLDIKVLQSLLKNVDVSEEMLKTLCDEAGFANKRERGEFFDKLKNLRGE